jgi:hypothetical protein
MKSDRHILAYGIRSTRLATLASALRSILDLPMREGESGKIGGQYYSWECPDWEITIFNHYDGGPGTQNWYAREWREFPIVLQYGGWIPLDDKTLLSKLRKFDITLVEHVVLDPDCNRKHSYYYDVDAPQAISPSR